MVYVGSKHPHWKGGETIYRDILIRKGEAKICKKCRTRDYRILAAHHLDWNRKNNELGNLVWLCHNCHFLVHHYDKERQRLMAAIA